MSYFIIVGSEPVRFSRPGELADYLESGLPPGAPWSLIIGRGADMNGESKGPDEERRKRLIKMLRNPRPPRKPTVDEFQRMILEGWRGLIEETDGELPKGEFGEPPVSDRYRVDSNALVRFDLLVRWLARLVFGVDSDYSPQVEISITDRERFQRSSYLPVPYESVDPERHRQAVMANAQIAQEELGQHFRWRRFCQEEHRL